VNYTNALFSILDFYCYFHLISLSVIVVCNLVYYYCEFYDFVYYIDVCLFLYCVLQLPFCSFISNFCLQFICQHYLFPIVLY